MMKIVIIMWVLAVLLIVYGEETTSTEETDPGLCGNSTEDSCEAFNNTESAATSLAEDVTLAPVVTKKPKTTTTPKVVIKKPPTVTNSTKRPQTNADCSCDTKRDGCEVNCCCDVDCSSDQRAVFTHCIPLTPTLDQDYCFPPQVLYHNNTDYKSAVTESGLLCVVQQNTVILTDFIDVPVIRTVAAFQKKLGRKKYFSWINPEPASPLFDPDIPYSNGSPLWISDNSTIKHLELPASAGSSSLCQSKVVPKYLEDTVTSCTKPLRSVLQCHELNEKDFSVISSPRHFNFTQVQECSEDVCLPVHHYICTNSCAIGRVPIPILNNESYICQNVVQSVEYKIYHNGSQGIVEVNAFYKLQNISIHNNQLFRKFHKVTYLWAGVADKPILKRSGRPGYETGRPIISGRQTLKKVEYNVSEEDWINVGTAGISGFCHNRYNLLFRENLLSRCLLTVNGTCNQIQQQIWKKMLGPITNLSELVISSFGDPQENNIEAWVPLLLADPPHLPVLTTTIEIIIVHSLIGAVAAPQAKIIGAFVSPVPTGVMCTANLTTVEVVTAVRFIDKTTPAVTKFAQPPVYEIKLPQDFFYPFLSKADKINHSFTYFILLIILLIYID